MSEKKQAKRTKTRILIVDDHPIVREGLAGLIDNDPDLAVCGQAEDVVGALKAVSETKPDLAIIDISLKDSSGIELIKTAKAQFPKMAVLVLSMHNEFLYAERALRAGADGYIMKQEAPRKLIQAIRQVLSGQIYVSEKISAQLIKKLAHGQPEATESPIDGLSDRELEVFSLIGQGYGTRDIAEKLYLSVKTIETYRMHIKEKLNLANSAELLRYAIQWVTSQDKP